jgi:hypothetical protein
VVPFGILAVAAGTLAYTQVTPDTSVVLLAASLFVRGIGMGFVMMPAMSSAYIHLSRAEVPRATTIVNILQRVGGSLGTALFAVVLERQIVAGIPAAAGGGENAIGGSVVGTPVAGIISDAFATTFWWVVGSTLLALIPALLLPRVGAAAALAAADPGASPHEPEITATAVDDLTDGAPMAEAAQRP